MREVLTLFFVKIDRIRYISTHTSLREDGSELSTSRSSIIRAILEPDLENSCDPIQFKRSTQVESAEQNGELSVLLSSF